MILCVYILFHLYKKDGTFQQLCQILQLKIVKGKKSHSHFRIVYPFLPQWLNPSPSAVNPIFPVHFTPSGLSIKQISIFNIISLLLPTECFLYKLLLSPGDKLKFLFLLGLTFGVVVLIVLSEHAETLGRPLPDQFSYINILKP